MPLFVTESVYTFVEYKRELLAVNKRFNIDSSTRAALVISIGVFMIAFVSGRYQVALDGFFIALGLFPLVWILVYFYKSIALSLNAEKSYDESMEESVVKFKLFSDYIEINGHHYHEKGDTPKALKFTYSDFDEIIETKNNFYLITPAAAKMTFFLVKENCSDELIDFVQALVDACELQYE